MNPKNCDRRQPNNPNYILIAVGLVLISTAIVLIIVDPMYFIIQHLSRISKGSMLFDVLQHKVPGMYLSVYIFNYTNSEAFLAGDDYKLKMQEVGPYTYQEYRENKNFEIDEDAGIMKYSPFPTSEFLPDKSIGDPRMVNVTVPNVAMLAAASMFSSYPIFVRSGFNILAAQLKSKPIINLDVHSLLWGYEEPLITFGNTLIPGWITFNSMGILDRLYDPAIQPRMEIVSANKDKFNIKTMDGCPGLNVWQYGNPSKRTRCNSFIDVYEGVAFPQGLTPERPLRIYRNIFCRMIDLEFAGKRHLDHTPGAFVYKFRNDTFSANTDTECLCGENDCIDGVTNMSPCFYGLSVGLSNAHFLHADPKIYERFEGIHPDEKQHGSEFVIDPESGLILGTSFTLQLNVIVKDVNFNSAARPFTDMVVPVLYLKVVQPELNDDLINILKVVHLVLPNVIYGIEIVLFSIGLIILLYTTRCLYWRFLFCIGLNLDTSNSKPTVNIPSKTPLVEQRSERLDIVKYKLDSDIRLR